MTRAAYDAVIIGSGFGGGMVARQLAIAGKSVCVVERGQHVARDAEDWNPNAILVKQRYAADTPDITGRKVTRPNAVVGGQSVFYGAVSLRLRELDFQSWPIAYDALEPYYTRAERLLGVRGVDRADPTEPRRDYAYDGGYVGRPMPYTEASMRLAAAASALGYRPFPIPLAINTPRCIQCEHCDLFPCQLGAKNDVAVSVLREAVAYGAEVRANTQAVRIVQTGDVAGYVVCRDDAQGWVNLYGKVIVVSAGAIQSPRLLLHSGLGGPLVGRYLMRHCNGVVIGLFPERINPKGEFQKQVAITDDYAHYRGMLQSLQVPPPEYVRAEAPRLLKRVAAATLPYQLYLQTITEDCAAPDNRITLHSKYWDRTTSVPLAHVRARYSSRDRQRRRQLNNRARRILRQAGAWVTLHKPINTYSHAVGTCRMAKSAQHGVVNPMCRVFDVKNLFVVDGSFMPTSGGVNPSLTIAANALRVGDYIRDEWQAVAR